jgi:hypothetical protein
LRLLVGACWVRPTVLDFREYGISACLRDYLTTDPYLIDNAAWKTRERIELVISDYSEWTNIISIWKKEVQEAADIYIGPRSEQLMALDIGYGST